MFNRTIWARGLPLLAGGVVLILVLALGSAGVPGLTQAAPAAALQSTAQPSATGAAQSTSQPAATGTPLSTAQPSATGQAAQQGGAPPLTTLFSQNYNVAFDTVPTVVNGVAYIGTDERPKSVGSVLAIDLSSGKLLWKADLSNWIMTNPLVVPEQGMVYVGSGNSSGYNWLPNGKVFRGTGENFVYGLDMHTGQVRWQFQTVGENMPTFVYQNGVVYFVNGDRNFYALDAATGQKLWSIYVNSLVSMSSPVLVGDVAYFGGADPYAVTAVNIKEHRIVWQLSIEGINGGLDDTPPVYGNGYLYTNAVVRDTPDALTGREYVFKIDANSGQLVWTSDVGYGPVATKKHENQGSPPLLAGNVLYTGANATKEMLAMDTQSGKILWRAPMGDWINAQPILLNGQLYAIGHDGVIHTLDPNSGNQLAAQSLDGPVSTGAWAAADGNIVVTTRKGSVYVLQPKSQPTAFPPTSM